MKASEYVKQFTDPFYQWFNDYGYFIIIVIALFLIIRLSVWAVKQFDARLWRKAAYGNTNTWFSIDPKKCNDAETRAEPLLVEKK